MLFFWTCSFYYHSEWCSWVNPSLCFLKIPERSISTPWQQRCALFYISFSSWKGRAIVSRVAKTWWPVSILLSCSPGQIKQIHFIQKQGASPSWWKRERRQTILISKLNGKTQKHIELFLVNVLYTSDCQQ